MDEYTIVLFITMLRVIIVAMLGVIIAWQIRLLTLGSSRRVRNIKWGLFIFSVIYLASQIYPIMADIDRLLCGAPMPANLVYALHAAITDVLPVAIILFLYIYLRVDR